MATNEHSALHAHEPEIPQVLAEDGRCRVCRVLVERDEFKRHADAMAVQAKALLRFYTVNDGPPPLTTLSALEGAIGRWERSKAKPDDPWRDDEEAQALIDTIADEPTERTQQTGVDLIAAERERQMSEEDWTPDHDDEHTDGSLASAAAAYAIPLNEFPIRKASAAGPEIRAHRYCLWPWENRWWRPARFGTGRQGRIRELVKAGALIAAEIDRLQRAAVADERKPTDA